jgi:short-subunit dehydrogenase
LPTASAYGASKAALVNMAESLYPDMKKQGIALSLVMPGFVKTPLTDKNTFPMPFRISAEEAATRIRRGMEKKHFLITFPRRFTTGLRLLRLLPYGLLFPLLAKATASRQGGVQPLGQQE